MVITKALRARLIQLGASEHASDDVLRKRCSDFLVEGKLTGEEFAELTKPDGSTTSKAAEFARLVAGEIRADDIAAKAFGTDGASTGPGPRIRVKDSSESYSLTKSLAGTTRSGEQIYHASEWEHAKTGVWFKRLRGLRLTDHEKAILDEMATKDRWIIGEDGQDLAAANRVKTISGLQVKALLDDATSGGAEITPEYFDTQVLQFPLLHGELAPYVTVRDVNRSAVEGASVGNPTFTWGTAEGSSLSLFTTTSLIAAIDTSIYPVQGAIEIGLDFAADSAVDIGRILMENYQQGYMKELDDQIASGSGSSRPLGIDGASVTTVASDNGSTGPWTINDLETLMSTVGKQYRNSRSPSICFLMNDTTYFRLRAIAVDTSSDQRRVLGMDMDRGSGASIESYSLLGRPVRINGDLANSYVGFGDLKSYWLYRRSGLQSKFETGGKTLTLTNTGILIVRARVGGQLADTNAWAAITDGQS